MASSSSTPKILKWMPEEDFDDATKRNLAFEERYQKLIRDIERIIKSRERGKLDLIIDRMKSEAALNNDSGGGGGGEEESLPATTTATYNDQWQHVDRCYIFRTTSKPYDGGLV